VFVVGAGIGKFAAPNSPIHDSTAKSPSPAAEATSKSFDGPCSDQNQGVTLIVDFGTESKQKPIEKCVTDFSGNGWQLFAAAGLKIEGTAKYPTGFGCRIEGLPVDQDCGDKATFDRGYWSYFYADSGAKVWKLSESGAADRSPKTGGFEGWVWTSNSETNKVPSISPSSTSSVSDK
jgi:hypothetical protein